MMRLLIYTAVILFSWTIYSQENVFVSWGNFQLDFEDTSDYKFVKIDTVNIWYIDTVHKQQLHLNNNAISCDTNEYYSDGLNTYFQLKLVFIHGCDIYFFSFNHLYDFEKNKDGGIIETSYDNGLHWNNIIYDSLINRDIFYTSGLYNSSDSIKSYNNQPGFTGLMTDLSGVDIWFWSWVFDQVDTMLLKYTFSSDSNNSNNEGWILDDFSFGGILVGLDENGENEDYSIFPNPSTTAITINNSFEHIGKIELYSIRGIKLLERHNTNVLDISNIEPGFYIVKINNRINKRLIVY